MVLAHGNRAENDVYLVLGLDTTIGQLKQQIQESLQQHPPPELQRLIYHGRPLLDGNVPLRQILRLDQRAGNTSHVLHLVIRDDNPSILPPDHRPAQSAQHGPSSLPSTPAMPPQHLPQQPHLHPTPGLPNLDHMRIHNQLHNIQHQLQHAQAMNRANQARLQAQHARLQTHTSPDSPAMANGVPPPPQPPQIHHPLPQGTPGPGPRLQLDGTRIEERIGPNGEHIRTTFTNNGTTSMTFRVTGINVPNPTDRPSSAPGPSPTANDDPANRSANPVPPNIQIHAQPPLLPPGFSFLPAMQLPLPFPALLPQQLYNPIMPAPPIASNGQTMAWLLSSPQGPQGIVFAPGHGFFTTLPSASTPPSQLQQQSNNRLQPTPTAPSTTTQHDRAPSPQRAQLTVRPQDGPPAPPQPGARPQPPAPAPANQAQPARQAQANRNEENALLNLFLARGWLFLRLYMFVFVLSESGTWRRIFMLGFAIIFCLLPRQNPFTEGFQAARRHVDNLIGPPQMPERRQQPAAPHGQDAGPNIANVNGDDAAAVAGRDNPNPTPTTAHNAQRPNGPVPGGPTRTRPHSQRQTAMPTPEEAARRLLAQQNRRNPNPIVDRLYRIEQGFALFFASLIPGLGERHVQAREQARRILEEEERREREERAEREARDGSGGHASGGGGGGEASASGSERKDQGGPLPSSWGSTTNADGGGGSSGQATSTGIDRNATGDGQGEDQNVRPRNTGGQ